MNIEEVDPYRTPNSSLAHKKSYNREKRVLVSALCVLLSSIGIIASLTLIASSLIGLFSGKLQATELILSLLSPVLIFAWTSFFIMILGWIKNEEVSEVWAIFGTISGVASALFMNALSLLVLPSIILAIYLVYFHLANGSNRSLRSLGQAKACPLD